MRKTLVCSSFVVISFLAPERSQALNGYVCSKSETNATQSNDLQGSRPDVQKYKINGTDLETVDDPASDLFKSPFFTYEIIQNTTYGLIAINAETGYYSGDPSASADVIIIDKTRMTINEMVGDSKTPAIEYTGTCVSY